ncbi:MAG: primosomal replication protein N [Candidatus Malihini olakiniferum]
MSVVAANRLELSGIICKAAARKISPSGIPHCYFVLEHRSVQEEAGLARQAWCHMPVIVSGSESHVITRNITVGMHIRVQGFICSHQGRNNLNKLVLHAKKIELIDSGD